jgi:hypothetical protein
MTPPDVVFLRVELRPRVVVEYVGGAIEALTGQARSEIRDRGGSLLGMVSRMDRPRLIGYLRDKAQWRQPIVVHLTWHDGTLSTFEVWLAPEVDDDSRVVALDIAARPVAAGDRFGDVVAPPAHIDLTQSQRRAPAS